ncbi:MAG: alpha/beta hydrolase [Bdellovibrionota bacterium]
MLLVLSTLSIFFTGAHAAAALEPRFTQAAQAVEQCLSTQPAAACYGIAAQTLAAYQASRADRTKTYDGVERSFSGPRVFLTGQVTDKVYVLVHSYTNSPSELDAIADELRLRGQNVFSILLEGHGSRSILGGGPFSLKDVSRGDWKQDLHFGVQLAHGLGRKVVLVGYSLGGLLSILEGSRDNPEIAGFLAVAPPVALNNRLWAGNVACGAKTMLRNAIDQIMQSKLGNGEFRTAYMDEYANGACELLGLIHEFNSLGFSANILDGAARAEKFLPKDKRPSEIMHRDFARLKVPYVIISSNQDDIIDHEILVRLTRLSSVNGTIYGSNAPNHVSYGLARSGSGDLEIFQKALETLDQVTGK